MAKALDDLISAVPINQLVMQKLVINQAVEVARQEAVRELDEGTFDWNASPPVRGLVIECGRCR